MDEGIDWGVSLRGRKPASRRGGGRRSAAAAFNFRFSSGRGSGFVVEGRFTFFQQKQNITVNNSLYFVIIITSKNL
jgi:hypothetical protein